MIDAELMQHRGMEIVNVKFVFHSSIAKFVTCLWSNATVWTDRTQRLSMETNSEA